jgi:hypothetical protein
MLRLDNHLVHKIALEACNASLFSVCKQILNKTTLHDRVLLAVMQNELRPETALRIAVEAGLKIGIIQPLVGASKGASDGALCIACGKGHVHIVQYLLEAGADVHFLEDQPLIISCRYGHSQIIELLLRAGADVHARENEAIRIATANGYTSILELLRSYSPPQSTT